MCRPVLSLAGSAATVKSGGSAACDATGAIQIGPSRQPNTPFTSSLEFITLKYCRSDTNTSLDQKSRKTRLGSRGYGARFNKILNPSAQSNFLLSTRPFPRHVHSHEARITAAQQADCCQLRQPGCASPSCGRARPRQPARRPLCHHRGHLRRRHGHHLQGQRFARMAAGWSR